MEKLPLKIEHDLITEASFELLKSETNREEMIHDYYDEDDVVEIPIVKRMRFKFGKPKIKIFET